MVGYFRFLYIANTRSSLACFNMVDVFVYVFCTSIFSAGGFVVGNFALSCGLLLVCSLGKYEISCFSFGDLWMESPDAWYCNNRCSQRSSQFLFIPSNITFIEGYQKWRLEYLANIELLLLGLKSAAKLLQIKNLIL